MPKEGEEREVVLVCGSFFIMTEARLYFNIIENSSEHIDFV